MRRDYDREVDNVLEFVITLSNLVEAKDAYTENHTRRVADIAIALGKHMMLNKEQLKNIELGAIIHDIGKVSTPESILNKPGKLTQEEFEIMKDHPVAGARIVKPITALQKTSEMVLSHHEKLDGSGYPNGLTADKIDIETRIIAVADIFDALYTDRPYRKGMTLEQSLGILDADVAAGKIDGRLVTILKEMVLSGEISKIYHEN